MYTVNLYKLGGQEAVESKTTTDALSALNSIVNLYGQAVGFTLDEWANEDGHTLPVFIEEYAEELGEYADLIREAHLLMQDVSYDDDNAIYTVANYSSKHRSLTYYIEVEYEEEDE